MVRMSTINGCLEREGLARLTISILVITTAGCLAYTWGYAEGVHNARTIILPSQAAAPIVVHATEVTLADSAVADGIQSSSNSSTLAVSHAKRKHSRRRARKDLPRDGPIVPADALPAGRAADSEAPGPALASSTEDTSAVSTSAAEDSAGHARTVLSNSRGLRSGEQLSKFSSRCKEAKISGRWVMQPSARD